MMDDTEDEECPVCCEPLDATDKAVNYCDCGYRMCIWCWNKLMETAAQSSLSGKCPNCRAVYDKDKITMSRVDPEMVMEERKKQKQERKKNPGAMPKNRKDLAHIRVVQRNLVYAVGLPLNLCREELLQEKPYFGQFGRMKKVSVNRVGPWAQAAAKGATGSCYVTYYRVEDAVRCIDAIDGATWGGKTIKACFGTTKYCNAFLKNVICNNPDCLYLHDVADEADSFYKDEVQEGVQLVRQQLLESLKVRGKGGTASAPPPPPAASTKAALAANAVVASALAPPPASKGAGATNAIAIPLKRGPMAQAVAAAGASAWGTTPDAQSPAVTAPPAPGPSATWVTAATPKPPPTTGLLADQEWPSLAPSRDDSDRPSDPDKPSEPPTTAPLLPARSGPWGEKPLSRTSSMGGEPSTSDSGRPLAPPTPTPTPAAVAAAAAAKQAKPKVITLTKPSKGKGTLVMTVGKGKGVAGGAGVGAAPGTAIAAQPPQAAAASTSGAGGEGAVQNGAGKGGELPAAAPSTPPALKKGKGATPAVAGGGAGGTKGAAAAAVASDGTAAGAVPSVTAAVAAATAAVVGAAAVVAEADRKEGAENGGAAAVAALPAGSKLVKGPPPGFSARPPNAALPSSIEPSVVAAVRAAASAAPGPSAALTPFAAPQPSATPPASIISPSDQPVASPPRPTANGILSSLFRQPAGGAPSPAPQPAPPPLGTPVPSLHTWISNGPSNPPTSTASSGPDHSLTFPTLPSAIPSPTLQPKPARPPPGFSQPLYPAAKLGLNLAPSGGLPGGDIDINALFSHIPPTPLDDPWSAGAPSTSQPTHAAPPPRLQSRFAFAREEGPLAAPLQQQTQQPRPSHLHQHGQAPQQHPQHPQQQHPQQQHPQQPQPEELSRLFQKIAPGASVHVAQHAAADSGAQHHLGGNGALANGAFNPGTPHSPNPGMALLAQLQRKPAPADALGPPTAGPLKAPPPGMAPTFADPAILTAGKNPLAGPPHYQQPPAMALAGGPPLGHHRPGELSLGGGPQVAAAGEPLGMRAPARGPPPGFANAAGGFPGVGVAGPPADSAPYPGPTPVRPLGGEALVANGHGLPNGHLHQQPKGYAPFGTRL